MKKRTNFMVLALVVMLVGTSSVLAQEITCIECHDDTTLITGAKTAWSESVHGTGESYGRGTRSSCAACHSGGAFSAMVAAGLTPDTVKAGDPNPTRQDCRACHQIHTSYTAGDWALETIDPVVLYAFENEIYVGGKGNLCANCHQPRRVIDGYVDDVNGVTNVSSSHWGPHHGPQSAMLLGVGGASAEGYASGHSYVLDTCVTCHLSENATHTFEANADACTSCHGEVDDFDIGGLQTEIEELIVQLRDLLLAKGLLAEETEYEISDDGVIEEVVVGYHPVVGVYPSAEAAALWDYIFIAIEDGSVGVHNPRYTKNMLNASIAALQ
ncbi:MAG: hypothetical protein JSW66_02195 [Phycisphaerales bacterium]|nr:MAG: hypothetical protein JSW66_02195 [Phycisphaerales bacterium]